MGKEARMGKRSEKIQRQIDRLIDTHDLQLVQTQYTIACLEAAKWTAIASEELGAPKWNATKLAQEWSKRVASLSAQKDKDVLAEIIEVLTNKEHDASKLKEYAGNRPKLDLIDCGDTG